MAFPGPPAAGVFGIPGIRSGMAENWVQYTGFRTPESGNIALPSPPELVEWSCHPDTWRV